MKPDIELTLRKMGIPINRNSKLNKVEKVMTISSGFMLSQNNSFYVKQAIVQLATNRGLRAAHAFLVERNRFEWNIFYPEDEPLTQSEVNGHMMFSIDYIKQPESQRFHKVKKSGKKLIFETNEIADYLEEIDEYTPLFIILVFDNLIFVTGNFIHETMLCKAILNYDKPDAIRRERTNWPDSNRRDRMIWYAKHKQHIFNLGGLIKHEPTV